MLGHTRDDTLGELFIGSASAALGYRPLTWGRAPELGAGVRAELGATLGAGDAVEGARDRQQPALQAAALVVLGMQTELGPMLGELNLSAGLARGLVARSNRSVRSSTHGLVLGAAITLSQR